MRTSRIVALALLVGTFFVAQGALVDLALGKPVRVRNDIGGVLRFWVVWALLTPFVLKALRRWPLDARPAYVPIVAHVSLAAILAPVHSIITLSVYPIASRLFGDLSLGEALRQNTKVPPLNRLKPGQLHKRIDNYLRDKGFDLGERPSPSTFDRFRRQFGATFGIR